MVSISFGLQNPLFNLVWFTHLVSKPVFVRLIPRISLTRFIVSMDYIFATQKAALCV